MASPRVQLDHRNLNGVTAEGFEGAEGSEIVRSFSNATVLVTGGTGFVGQLLIEKMLRCCPDLKKIYMLAREKRGKSINTRIEDQFKDQFYDKLRAVNPDFSKKVQAIAGDCGELGLGVSNDDRISLINEVNVIFHCAATVRFDEPLKAAVAINTRGTREMLRLARDCKDLKVLLHVSTAYSNCYLEEIKEQFYDVTLPGDKLIDLAESMDEETLNIITPGLIHGHPNTYTYTKKAAEDLILRFGQDLPIAIVRPAIVCGTRKEPLAGWSGNIYGLAGALIAAAVGLLHVYRLSTKIIIDAVPGDMVSDTCIAAASKTASLSKKDIPSEPPIYMVGTSPLTPIKLVDICNICEMHYQKYPSIHAIYECFSFFVDSYWLYKVLFFIFHWIPAYVLDGFAMLVGKKPVMRKIYTKAENMVSVLDFFMNKEWKFSNANTVSLYESLSAPDKRTFDFDFKSLDWNSYLEDYVIGSRVYIMKDPLENIEQGRKKKRLVKVLHYFVCTVLLVMLYGFYRGTRMLLALV